MREWSRLSRRMLTVVGITLMAPLILQSGWLFYELTQAWEHAPMQALGRAGDERLGLAESWIHDRLDLLALASPQKVDTAQAPPIPGGAWVLIEQQLSGAVITDGPPSLKGLRLSDLTTPVLALKEWLLLMNHALGQERVLALAIPQSQLLTLLQRVEPHSEVLLISSTQGWQRAQVEGRLLWHRSDPHPATAVGGQPAGTNFYLLSLAPHPDPIRQQVDQEIRLLTWVLCSLLILCCVGAWILTRKMTRPMDRLLEAMEEVSRGDLSLRLPQDRWAFEMNDVARSFNQMLDHFVATQEQVVHERTLKERLAHELALGKDLQNALLPSRSLRIQGVEVAAYYQAARDVGGDFYDLVGHRDEGGNESLTVTIADVSGKGLEACLYSLTYRALYRAFAYQASSFDQVVEHVNRLLCWDTQENGYFITAWMGEFVPATGVLRYTSAGHPLAIVVRKDGSLQKLAPPGLALGVDRDYPYHSQEISIAAGEALVLYTDGLIEQPNPSGEFFGEERLWQLLLQQRGRSAEEMKSAIEEALRTFAQSSSQYDDLTFLVLRRTVGL